MKLIIETVRFSEPDLRKFHPEGFEAVQTAVETAHHARATARTAEEMLHARHLAELANERRQAELRLGETFFDKARNRTFFLLGNTRAQLTKSSICGSRRGALEETINAAATRYACKDFEACRKLCEEVKAALMPVPAANAKPKITMITRQAPVGPSVPALAAPADYSPSPSVLYESGRKAEQNRRYEDAAEAYRKVLAIRPNHIPAQSGLERLRKLASASAPRRHEAERKIGRLA